MSVVSVETTEQRVDERRRVEHRQENAYRPQAVPGVKPQIRVRTRYVERPAAKPSIWPSIVAKAASFGIVAFLTFSASSVAGQVMVEKARKDSSEAHRRTLLARKAEGIIRDRVDYLTRADRIEEWAMSHGMVAADGLGATTDLTSNNGKRSR